MILHQKGGSVKRGCLRSSESVCPPKRRGLRQMRTKPLHQGSYRTSYLTHCWAQRQSTLKGVTFQQRVIPSTPAPPTAATGTQHRADPRGDFISVNNKKIVFFLSGVSIATNGGDSNLQFKTPTENDRVLVFLNKFLH
ncbi:hypothetical protein KIL84_017748 [Mauremys mutica]|uniref:Uncharacterized protein n=1 Tax=Mauremys mutica TaxID=74926 RepID=A0A9D4AXT0_9SAUR|nr:hypothetical protein KIL84_017748 [Mauremys mutica]